MQRIQHSLQGKALGQMVGAQRIEGTIPSRRKLQELTAQRVRYHHIPAASQYRISLQHGRDTGNGNLYRYGMDRRYHARQLERHKNGRRKHLPSAT